MTFPGQQQQQFHQQMNMQIPPYNDSILTITEKSCADPYVLWDKGTYYMVRQLHRLNYKLILTDEDMDHRLLCRDLVSGQLV
jgi:hypothetical protein